MPDKETTAKEPASPASAAVGGDHDRVVMASRKADGTPDQTPDFEYIGDKETTLKATKTQLTEQAVSAADVAERGVTSGEAEDDSGLPGRGPQSDPSIAAIDDRHQKAAKAAEKAAESEVDARFTDDPKLGAKRSGASGRSTTTSRSAASRETTADDQPS